MGGSTVITTMTVVASLPTVFAAAGDTISVVLVQHGARWADVLSEATGVVREDELQVLRRASECAETDRVLHRDIPEDVRGRLRLFCMEH